MPTFSSSRLVLGMPRGEVLTARNGEETELAAVGIIKVAVWAIGGLTTAGR